MGPLVNPNAVQAADVRVGGFSWRAEMLPTWKPSYVGAVRETRYYRFCGAWELFPYASVPKQAYRALRKALAADIKRGPIE